MIEVAKSVKEAFHLKKAKKGCFFIFKTFQ